MDLLELVESRTPLITLSQGKLPTFIFCAPPVFPSHLMKLIQLWSQVLVHSFPRSGTPFTQRGG